MVPNTIDLTYDYYETILDFLNSAIAYAKVLIFYCKLSLLFSNNLARLKLTSSMRYEKNYSYLMTIL